MRKIVTIPDCDDTIVFIEKFKILGAWRDNYEDGNFAFPSIKQKTSITNQELDIALPLARLTYLLSDDGLKALLFSEI